MNSYSILMVGACTITGFHISPASALPVLIKRAFRNNAQVKVSINSNTSCIHNQKLEQMHAELETELELKKFDIVILQFFNSNLLTVVNRDDYFKWNRRLFKHLRSIIKRSPDEFGRILYNRFASRFIEVDYKRKLCKCVELVRSHNKNCNILLMTPIPPTSEKVKFASDIFHTHYQDIYEIASNYCIDVADFYTPLQSFSPNEVYQADGTHLTDKGQKVVAEAIINKLASIIRDKGIG